MAATAARMPLTNDEALPRSLDSTAAAASAAAPRWHAVTSPRASGVRWTGGAAAGTPGSGSWSDSRCRRRCRTRRRRIRRSTMPAAPTARHRGGLGRAVGRRRARRRRARTAVGARVATCRAGHRDRRRAEAVDPLGGGPVTGRSLDAEQHVALRAQVGAHRDGSGGRDRRRRRRRTAAPSSMARRLVSRWPSSSLRLLDPRRRLEDGCRHREIIAVRPVPVEADLGRPFGQGSSTGRRHPVATCARAVGPDR